jgi:hypothetical protein
MSPLAIARSRTRKSVDLDEDDAGAGIAPSRPARGKLAHERAEERLVVGDREDGGEERVCRGVHDRPEDGAARSVDDEAARCLRGGEQCERLKEQRRDTDERHGDPREQSDEYGSGDRRDEREFDGNENGGCPRTNADARQQPQRDRERGER